MRPVIGITTRARLTTTSGGKLEVDLIQHTYRDAVAHAGGIPLPLSPVTVEDVPALLDRIDGLLLSGGGDVSTATYNGHKHSSVYEVDEQRDEFEFALTHGAQDRHMPILAICRGLQVVNVALGETLIEDIPSETGATDHIIDGKGVFKAHQLVTLDPTCAIARVVGTDRLMVNSIHHQAVREVAPGLRAVGTTADGIIEAIEPVDRSWPLLAVQWHPEYLASVGDAPSRALFSAHITAAQSNT